MEFVHHFLRCWTWRCNSGTLDTWPSRSELKGFVCLKELNFGEIQCFSTSYQGLSLVKGKRIVSYAYKLLKSFKSAALCGRPCGKAVSIKILSLSAPPPLRCLLVLPFKTVERRNSRNWVWGTGSRIPPYLRSLLHRDVEALEMEFTIPQTRVMRIKTLLQAVADFSGIFKQYQQILISKNHSFLTLGRERLCLSRAVQSRWQKSSWKKKQHFHLENAEEWLKTPQPEDTSRSEVAQKSYRPQQAVLFQLGLTIHLRHCVREYTFT